MNHWLAVAAGGAIGAKFSLGCPGRECDWFLVDGAALCLAGRACRPERRMAGFFMVGLLGAFTTFSTFSIETLVLIEQGDWLRGMSIVTASVLVCVLAAALGVWSARQLV